MHRRCGVAPGGSSKLHNSLGASVSARRVSSAIRVFVSIPSTMLGLYRLWEVLGAACVS